ncbi:MAG: TonB-dependent receptor [Prevotella sp.]|nr:TonB-dependent receptor [Prevotella sp.]MBQ6210925.1 TonB-dependent receptor [Prevotella sp.]
MKKIIISWQLMLVSAWVVAAPIPGDSIGKDTVRTDFWRTKTISEVVVTGVTGLSLMKETPLPFTYVSKEELQTTSSTNVIDAIAHQPGMAQVTTGSSISKPIIRGLGYNRVAVVNDGIRQEGQQWGDEHGIEMDGQAVSSVEILKGPASLMYGSDAMAGVLIFHNDPILPKGTMAANASLGYQTNNGLFDYSVNFAGNKQPLSWNVRYSERMAHAYHNKYDGYVVNSQFHERALSGLLGWHREWGRSHLTLSYYHLTPGIVEGERDEVTGELTLPYEGYKVKTYKKALPFQQIHHYKAVSDNTIYAGEGSVKLIVGYQQNRRQEFEEDANEAELDLRLHTINYDLRYTSPEMSGWKVAAGMNGMYQQSVNGGEEFLIPDYNLFDWGIFSTASWTSRHWTVSGGLRFDTRHTHGKALEGRFNDFTRNFQGMTGSVGATYCLTEQLHIRMNVARGFRCPNMSEMASNGVHEGSIRYELGQADLSPEHSWQGDIGLDLTTQLATVQLSLFANHIDHYIFSRRLAGVTTEGFPTYQYTSGDARLWGGEVSVEFHPVDRLHVMNSFSYVYSRLLHQPIESRYLPFTPAPRWNGDVRWDIPVFHRLLQHPSVSIGWECYLKQDHIYSLDDTETATPSYTLLKASAGTDILRKGKRIATINIIANNILNRAYQSHLSRLKYADINAKTGRQGIYDMGRNICVKLTIPIAL